MEGLKVENLQNFFKSVGLEDSDFEKLSKEDIEDFTPFVDKAKEGIKAVLMSDTEFIDNISKPFKDLPIGKEKQLKKEARKFFNLTIKEDDLTKMPLADILQMGTANLKSTDNEEIEKYKNAYSELLEENEKLKNEVLPNSIKEIESKWESKVRSKDIYEELMSEVAKETQVSKENISVVATTFIGYLNQLGLKLDMDAKRTIKIFAEDGLQAKSKEGGVLHLKDALKDFSTKMQMNVKPVGEGGRSQAMKENSTARQLLSQMGKGFN